MKNKELIEELVRSDLSLEAKCIVLDLVMDGAAERQAERVKKYRQQIDEMLAGVVGYRNVPLPPDDIPQQPHNTGLGCLDPNCLRCPR